MEASPWAGVVVGEDVAVEDGEGAVEEAVEKAVETVEFA